MVHRDRFNENYGGVCPKTGEERIDLNLSDFSLEGVVPVSVQGEIFEGKISSMPYWTLRTHFEDQGGMEPEGPWLEVDDALAL